MNLKTPFWILLLAAGILTACNAVPPPPTEAPATLPGNPGQAPEMPVTGPVTESYPADSALPNRVLTVGTFHSNEVWEGAEKASWTGLFKDASGYYFAPATLHLQRVQDVVADDAADQATGWEVETTSPDSCLILVEGMDPLQTHTVPALPLPKTELLPGDTLHLNFKGSTYTLFATGDRETEAGQEGFFVKNYRLYVSARRQGTVQTTLLAAQPDFDDRMITILFAGDIDGDGLLDFIIDTARHYNVTSPTLYLSKPAPAGKLVLPVGSHTSVGC